MTITKTASQLIFSGPPESARIPTQGGVVISVYQLSDGVWEVMNCNSFERTPYRDGITYTYGHAAAV